jgi:hypothetical protein
LISPQNTLCAEPSHIRRSDIGVIEATSKDPKLDISCQLQFSHRLEAGGWLGAGCHRVLPLKLFRRQDPKKRVAGNGDTGRARTSKTLLTKLNGRLQVTEVGDRLIIVLDNPLLILHSTWFGYFFFTLRYLYLDLTN